MKRGSAPASAAFTLIELVISVALASVILMAAYACMSAALAGRDTVESRSTAIQGARVALDRIAADLRAALPLSSEFEFLGMQRTLGDARTDNLDFATHNYSPRGDREGDICEVSYFVSQSPETGRLTLWRRRDPIADGKPLEGGYREEILEGVRELRYEYYDGFDWYDEWGDTGIDLENADTTYLAANLYGMPEAVRITLTLEAEAGEPRGGDSEADAAMLAFQTVVRLELAAAAFNSSFGGDTDTGGLP